MAKYLRLFKNVEDANLEGSKGLYAPHVDLVDDKDIVNFADSDKERFTCSFNNNGKIEDIEPVGNLYKIKQFNGQPYLGETYIEDYDFTEANRFLVNTFCANDFYESSFKLANCSSCRNGSYAGRNLDWFIKNYAMLVVHVPANAEKGRLASVGICSSNPMISKEVIANGLLPDKLKFRVKDKMVTVDNFRNNFPVFTTDGVNEFGVCVNTNIVLHEEGVREGYVPCSGHGGELISFVALPRYVLDNCKSCDEAITKLGSLSVVESKRGPLSKEDSHLMVSDANKTVIFEWYNNEFVYTVYAKERGYKSPNGLPCIMTNFYNSVAEMNTVSGTTNWDNLLLAHPYAMGIERFRFLMPDLETVNSIESMKQHIERVLYTKYYNPLSLWYTENPRDGYFKEDGQWKYYKDFKLTEKGIAIDVKDAMVKCYNTYQMEADTVFGSLDKQMEILNSGKDSDFWYTELTSIFDIDNKQLYIMPQEGWYKKEYIKFTIN